MIKFKKFKIEEVLQWQSQKEIDPLKINELTIKSDIKYPFYGQSTIDNGIISYLSLTESVLNNKLGKPTILIHSNNQNIVYLETPFYLKDGHGATSVLQSDNLNEKIALYIITCIKKVITKKFAYNEKATKSALKNTYIKLPVNNNNEIDYIYMENCIRKLEEKYIREFSVYLTASKLDNYKLSNKELELLTKKIVTKEYKLEKLFKAETGNVDLQQKDIDGKGEYFINSGIQNYGIKGKTTRKAKIFSDNTITIDFFGNAYYRPFKYKMATHNHVFSLSGDIIKNEKVGLYLVSQMSYFKQMFSYSNMATWNKIKGLSISLPVNSNGNINFDYMEEYINILEKLTIKDVVEWKNKIVTATKKCC
ncbi:hypothetical protein D4Z93_03420 [Clostridium fermenticellae]|uniref:Type I restriction modification DNA specificity domain-containing protein n=1 Tax=Clostridium fermenticellae TaxID=2068654 RepID=A0A386H1R8_9CLOT|nr:restriction endonuclease subunit S [Clostridium fermenticellae]AYD39604.1 hypothetical protein D4Z93_03330 [Clostridium fermenticellae]AYD39620.1 hypothetical protein D4Z93_03420 [Clostridium fermenticellae]